MTANNKYVYKMVSEVEIVNNEIDTRMCNRSD